MSLKIETSADNLAVSYRRLCTGQLFVFADDGTASKRVRMRSSTGFFNLHNGEHVLTTSGQDEWAVVALAGTLSVHASALNK